MTIYRQGTLNTTALITPDLDIQIVPPQTTLLNGVPTDILGIVGTAQWGPVGRPVTVGNMSEYSINFGAVQVRKFDMGTGVVAALLQGASNFRCVRVTDGTDVHASATVASATGTGSGTGATLAAKYSGTLGNLMSAVISSGSSSTPTTPTWKVMINIPGYLSEVFDNIGGTGAAVWANIAAAINMGNGALRGPSNLVTATAGSATAAPVAATTAFTGGTDGVTTITSQILLGTDGFTRTGMYALRESGASIGFLADADDSTTWSTQLSFAVQEGIYMILVAPAGSPISNGTTGTVDLKAAAGIDDWSVKVLHGDWVLFQDTANNVQRYISPQGFNAGTLANLSPEQSSLNKQVYGVIGTQRSLSGLGKYSKADTDQLIGVNIDVITLPVPGGQYFGARGGRNAASNAVVHGDNYTRMTNYIAATLNAGMGIFIGQLQSPTVRADAKATLDAFFQNLWDQGMIGSADGSVPYQVILDDSNNSATRVALGYMQANVKVVYLSVIEQFLVNVEGGQSVTITRTSTQSASLAA